MHWMEHCTANLDDDAAFVVTNGNIVGAPHGGEGPHPLQPIVESGLQSVGARVPHANCACKGGTGQSRSCDGSRDTGPRPTILGP